MRTVLSRHGYTVIAADASRARNLVCRNEPAVLLLITNNPAAFASDAAHVPLLYLAAQPDESLAAPYRRWRALRKPFKPYEIVAEVKALAGASGRTPNSDTI